MKKNNDGNVKDKKNNNNTANLNWLYLKVKPNQGENQTLQILYKVVKCAQTLRISEILKRKSII